MTEKIDSLAFFDQLAATSQSNVEHDRHLDTIRPSKKQPVIVQDEFNKKWMDFTRAYKAEKQGTIYFLFLGNNLFISKRSM